MTLHRVSRFVLAIGLLALPAPARAQAFGLNEIGTCALSRALRQHRRAVRRCVHRLLESRRHPEGAAG